MGFRNIDRENIDQLIIMSVMCFCKTENTHDCHNIKYWYTSYQKPILYENEDSENINQHDSSYLVVAGIV